MRGLPPGPRSVRLVGALCFSRGKQRFSVAGKSSKMIMRFSAGNPRGFRARTYPIANFPQPVKPVDFAGLTYWLKPAPFKDG